MNYTVYEFYTVFKIFGFQVCYVKKRSTPFENATVLYDTKHMFCIIKYSRVLKWRTPFLDMANLESKYLENCHEYKQLTDRKVSRHFLMFSNLEIANFDEIQSKLHFFQIFKKVKTFFT